MSEDDGPAERKKRFTVPSEDSDVAPIKPLFRSLAGSDVSAKGDTVAPRRTAGTYADYVFKQAVGVAVPHRAGVEGQVAASTSVPRVGPSAATPTPGPSREGGRGPAVLAASAGGVGSAALQPGGSGGQAGPVPRQIAAPESVAPGEGAAPTPAKVIGKGNSLVVSPRQRGNPILKFVRNVPWEFEEIVPDYVMGPTTCALYLSLRYHNLNPNYIHERLKVLGQAFALRVLLVQVDVKDPHFALKELAKICILADCTLILAWSAEEAGRYLETYKSYEQKPADVLKEKVDQDFMSKMTDCLTTVKSVNKTDCTTLLSTFGSFADLTNATREDLSLCPGLGPQKAKRLFDVLHEPFQKNKK